MPAAGIGERARSRDSQEPKQFRLLGGRPLVAWAVDAAAAAGCAPVVVVLPEGSSGDELGLQDEAVVLATGGPTRQQSVSHGLALVDSDLVVVHDAARPFATQDLVREVVTALRSSDVDAVVPGIPMDETIKNVDPETHLVSDTVDRTSLWRVQTPAAFRTAVLKEAHRRADSEAFVGTDESQLVERFTGGRILIVPGSRANLKITFPEDLALAEVMLKARG